SGPTGGAVIGTGSATGTINNDDTALVSIAATTGAAEPSTNGKFTVTQSALSSTDTVISYTVGGTATAGDDYTTLSGPVTIPAAQTSPTMDVTVADDAIVEGTETVTVTLDPITSSNPGVSINGASKTATVNIADNDTAKVSIAATDGAEPSTNGKF